MNLIQWHDSFSVGVQLIDNQHQQLFALVNDLIMAINQNQEDAILEDLLHSVFAYTEMHFKAEEELFKIHPQFNGHREVHQKFVMEDGRIVAHSAFMSSGMDEIFFPNSLEEIGMMKKLKDVLKEVRKNGHLHL